MPHVLVAKRIAAAGLALLEQAPGFTVEVLDDPTEDAFLERVPDADAALLFFRPLRAKHIQAATRLRFVSRHGVGYDAVDVESLNARGIPLSITATANATAVAEHTVALLLSVAHRITGHDQDVRAGLWQARARTPMMELTGKTALVIGGGRIGSETARRLLGLGMQVQCFDPALPASVSLPAGIHRVDHLALALAQADVVSLHIPFTEQNRHLIDPWAMKSGSILINTARGELFDENVLADALQKRHLFGAGVDVFASEPVAEGHPLSSLDNVVLSPHNASLTDGGLYRMGTESATNIIDFFNGHVNPACIVNRQVLAI
jgi:D-3-phosphoglycerate dehydrogenase